MTVSIYKDSDFSSILLLSKKWPNVRHGAGGRRARAADKGVEQKGVKKQRKHCTNKFNHKRNKETNNT